MNTSRIIQQAGIMLILTTLTACTPNKAWRTVNNFKECTSTSPECLQEQEKEECLIESIEDKNGNILYSLGFLEFTDRGNLFDNQARDDLLRRIENDAKENGAL
ncbi:MAG: hypothetical protein D3909_19550, partial [Candidatus Electrothrix sp. ATG1]|nr:hypothetical protein [Candidatus Electrothrix sp. ATG1]